MRRIKIGIDVGGTFTHAVAVNTADHTLIGQACVPTTHKAKEGVAAGVVESMKKLIHDAGIEAEEVLMIAHSTTQATNALLEGDVACVGIVLLGRGLEGKIGYRQIANDKIRLAPGIYLKTVVSYCDTDKDLENDHIIHQLKDLEKQGAEVMVASEVYGIDDTQHEEKIVSIARKAGYRASSASAISKLYGLRVRTRTAVINAAMMPKMLETADMTEKAVRDSGIDAPLMIMRSDGGIMDINEMRKRPILTMLSGPAAGVAAALMYARVSDGIFLEVGGTSTDISIIKNGKPQVKSAQIGGNRLYLRALDVRTLGIAGGSIPRISDHHVGDVGPRSAHIADLQYTAFSREKDFRNIELEFVKPKENDPDDYLAVNNQKTSEKYTLTPTAASHFLGFAGEADKESVNSDAVRSCFYSVAKILGMKAETLAERILFISSNKLKPVIKQLVREYKLDEELIELVGGGGGAPAIVPYAAKAMDLPFKISENTGVISAIGAALGIIRDMVEKTVLDPGTDDILAVRKEAVDSVLSMGADPETIEATVEVDAKNKRVIATATGSGEMRTKEQNVKPLSEGGILEAAARSMKTSPGECTLEAATGQLYLVSHRENVRRFFGLVKKQRQPLRILDRQGIVKLQFRDARKKVAEPSAVKKQLSYLIEELTTYGDAGALLPDIFIMAGAKIIDLSGLIEEKQMLALADIELQHLPRKEKIAVIGAKK
ncbi:MAG: hydantoinase/oxoprolinase family protein [Candidatus Marinimicrobia bacterium]|nr:hydantoinase/oxoprolinase family protein [Candidatus Neomarinimicrobiota bacterium]